MLRRLWLVAIIACSAPARPAPSPPPAPAPSDPLVLVTPAPVPPPPPGVAAPFGAPRAPAASSQVVVISSGAASRGPASPRVLRKLVAHRQGALEIATGYAQVGLTLTKIESGTLDDPNYPQRPVGTNHLEVVLLDDAAFASDKSLDGFAGKWTLTRTADGILYVSSITDTPYDPKRAADRRALIDQARTGLHGGPDERLAALAILDEHPFLQLVPDVIALLGDQRTGNPSTKNVPRRYRSGPRVISDAADATLRKLVEPFAAGREPQDRDQATWRLYWTGVLGGTPARERVVTGAESTIAVVPMPQSWPELVALPNGVFAFGVSRLDTPIDNHTEGLAVTAPPYQTRTWFGTDVREELDAAIGPGGAIGLLSASQNDAWNFSLVQQGRATPPIQLFTNAKHAALAASSKEYLVVYIRAGERVLHAQLVSEAGRSRGAAKDVPLPAEPAAWYHRGFHALKAFHRDNGWLVAVEIRNGVMLVSLDDKLALAAPPVELARSSNFTQPKLVMGKTTAFVVWTQGARQGLGRVGFATVKPDGTQVGTSKAIGDEVWDVSRPVVLDDGGFAVAWIEAGEEVHVGRWNAAGDFVASVIAVPHAAIFLTLALGRDGKHLVVGYQDVMRYPYRLVALRIDPAAIN